MRWQLQAACLGVDPELFYPGVGENATEAKAVCARCPVASPCLEEALAAPQADDTGIRAGTSARERRRIRRARMEAS